MAAAGIIITNKDGDLTLLYPHSGHYRPGEADMQRCLFFMHRKGVDLRTFDIDIQQISHVSRGAAAAGGGGGTSNNNVNSAPVAAGGNDNKTAAAESSANNNNVEKTNNSNNNKKKKKVDTLQLENAVIVACFLAHKARFIGRGIFRRIQQIAVSDATTVTEALLAVDYGGYWRQKREVPC